MSAEVLDHYHTYGRREGEEDFPNTLISGISTFLGARVIPPVKDQLVDAGVKAAVLGMPWEGTNTCRPGASYGPRAIRRATEHYLSYHGEFQVDLFDTLGLADCGDVAIVPGNARRTFDRAERCITEIYEAGAFPIIVRWRRLLPDSRDQRDVQADRREDGLHPDGLPHGYGRGRGRGEAEPRLSGEPHGRAAQHGSDEPGPGGDQRTAQPAQGARVRGPDRDSDDHDLGHR